MAEESAPRVDERPATYKRKMQVWLAAAVAVIMLLLLVLTVLNVLGKMKEKKAAQDERPPPAAAPKVDRQDQFSQLVSNRKPSRQAVTEPAGGEGGASLEEQFDKLKAQGQFPGATERITIDGLRVEFPDGFGLARPSNTTPVVVLRFEADTPAALERIQDAFRQAITAVWPGIELPF